MNKEREHLIIQIKVKGLNLESYEGDNLDEITEGIGQVLSSIGDWISFRHSLCLLDKDCNKLKSFNEDGSQYYRHPKHRKNKNETKVE